MSPGVCALPPESRSASIPERVFSTPRFPLAQYDLLLIRKAAMMSGASPSVQPTPAASKRATRNPWAWIPTLYLAQGLPFTVVNFVSIIMYKSLGVSNADIAFYTAWLYLPWMLKPLWSPVVDILKTRRWWIWLTQLLVGACFAAVALTLPLPMFFQATLAVFYLVAFSSATHDIAADGFYMLALSEKQQAFFVGVRSTFFRISMVAGQGVLVILAGYIQTRTGLPSADLRVVTKPGTALVQAVSPELLETAAAEEGPLRVVLHPDSIEIDPQPRNKADIDALMATAKEWNSTNDFIRTRQRTQATGEKAEGPSWWSQSVSGPLGDFLRKRFGPDVAPQTDIAGNIGLTSLRLSKPPGREVVVTPAFKTGDRNVSMAEGTRLVFDDSNWNTPALVVIQIDHRLRAETSAQFEIRSGNIPLSWSIIFGVLVGLFLCFSVYHWVMLPLPQADRPGDVHGIPAFIREFLKTFGSFFRKEHIGRMLLFLLFYRFAEAQLVRLAAPFLLDGREVGGLALTTGQVGFVYGTVGTISLLAGGLLGGFLASRNGLRAWIWPMVIAIQVPNLVYVYLSYAQPDAYWIVNLCVSIEQFGYGFGFAAYLLCMIYIAKGAHKTAHYAICTGFMAMGMMLPGMFSGWLQELIGYQHFFIWVLLATIPGFIVVALLPLDPEFGKKTTAG
jgi:MFS transporter, PAT family, beta-lactamase induction signal transducer AmpG